ncbi:MAG: hypothetical protein NWF00_05910 [Candidatus Bathyarchaeota archaeon]|nr:hypothetical protein [Candidatus Bathyarchaeota archaeon]
MVDSAGSAKALFLDDDNQLHIGYQKYDELKYALWNGTHWNNQTLVSSEELAGVADMAFDSKGNLHIAYAHPRINNEGYVELHLTYAFWDGSHLVAQIVDSTLGINEFPSIAVSPNGVPHISYFHRPLFSNSSVGSLRYATRTALSANWTTQTIDTTNYAFSSIAVDSKGYPHASYYNGSLRDGVWNGTIWDIQTVDPPIKIDDVSSGSQIVLDFYDTPHISCVNYTNQMYVVEADSKWGYQADRPKSRFGW